MKLTILVLEKPRNSIREPHTLTEVIVILSVMDWLEHDLRWAEETSAAYFYLAFTGFLKEKCIDILEERKIRPVNSNSDIIKSVQSNGSKDMEVGKWDHI